MKATTLHGTVIYSDFDKELPTGLKGYEFKFNGETYFIPKYQLIWHDSKYTAMKHTTSNNGLVHLLRNTILEANTLAEIKRFAKYTL